MSNRLASANQTRPAQRNAPTRSSLARQPAMASKGLLPQPELRVGAFNDPREREAEHVADRVMSRPPSLGGLCSPARVQRTSATPRTSGPLAPASVHQVLSRPGVPMEPAVRQDMEQRLGHSFERVRMHTGSMAERSAQAVSARAFTVGRDVVFNAGQYAPTTAAGQRLIAHELTHVLQQGGSASAEVIAPMVQRERQTSDSVPESGAAAGSATPGTSTAATAVASAGTPAPRQDYVFIMGEDSPRTSNPFYRLAERYYRAHLPGATFVINIRNLHDLLDHVATHIQDPIGNLYLVTHANEDGTVSFGLDSADADAHLTVRELREALHPASGSASRLPAVSGKIDDQTRIRIKGCDLGRTQEMVELLDEAFGGAGTVTAPTHEQGFNADPTLEAAARRTFRAGVEATHAMPPDVDASLRGRERSAATAARRTALRERRAAITAELSARRDEENLLAARAGNVESLSGPMFQRPGTTRFTATELTPEVNRLYAHLSPTRRRQVVTGLVANDGRSASVAGRNGVVGQRGQRVYSHEAATQPLTEPANLGEANRVFRDDFRTHHFRATSMAPAQVQANGNDLDYTFEVHGRVSSGRRDPPVSTSRIFTTSRPNDASLITLGQAQLPNPSRYAWRVRRTHASSGISTFAAIAERVVAYLHHGSLNPGAHDYFARPESDRDFYATSTFTPPAAPPAGGTTP